MFSTNFLWLLAFTLNNILYYFQEIGLVEINYFSLSFKKISSCFYLTFNCPNTFLCFYKQGFFCFSKIFIKSTLKTFFFFFCHCCLSSSPSHMGHSFFFFSAGLKLIMENWKFQIIYCISYGYWPLLSGICYICCFLVYFLSDLSSCSCLPKFNFSETRN